MSAPVPPVDQDARTPRRVAAHLGVMMAVAVVMGLLVACLTLPFAGVLSVVAKDVSKGVDDLPADLETEDLSQKTRIYDVNGDLIASLYDENRISVPLSQISRRMTEAIVSIEDYRFYQHGALDLKGTIRAFVTNQAGGGAVQQGGSSITQQLVKLTLVNQADGEEERAEATADTYERKLRELRYAVAMEEEYSKDWILERYLNIAYFGDGAHGIQAAARHYFSVNAKDLNVKQAATLAGLVKNPNGYNPVKNKERALDRRNTVLDRMAELSVIPEEQAAKLKKQKLGLKIEDSPNGCQQSQAQFYCDYVVRYLMEDPAFGEGPTERLRKLKNGGLTIHTNLDMRMQKAADESVSNHVYATDQAVGGLAMVEPKTGAVRAIAQSRPMGTNRKKGETHLNYAVPEQYGDANGFQAGSTFKVFVLAAAIRQGIPLNTQINSPQSMFIPDAEFETCDGPYYGSSGWPVSNSTGHGSYNLYTGTQNSVNTFFAQLETRTGMCEPLQLAEDMGVNIPEAQQVPSWILGVSDSNPVEMAQAYATFANRGIHCEARPVDKVQGADGQVIAEYKPDCEQVLPQTTADAVNDILRGVMEGGFGSGFRPSGVYSAGKTGTTQDNKSVWFVGYTPDLATASMIAGAEADGDWRSLNGLYVGGSYVSSASGSGLAGPMWGDAMSAITQYLSSDDFVAPAGTEVAGVLTAVPDVRGMSISSATSTLEAKGFKVTVGYAMNSGYAEGTVAATSPGAYEMFGSGDTITLYPSTGVKPKPDKKNKKKDRGRGPGDGRGRD
ncbi:MAG: transglycosylase domain-containing protein [Nocardioides sp.]|uniref:transglycosylase domain-containing protein n=1 Tax=Nocardioides sp. TaxID=35761 RepID=UPI003F0EE973